MPDDLSHIYLAVEGWDAIAGSIFVVAANYENVLPELIAKAAEAYKADLGNSEHSFQLLLDVFQDARFVSYQVCAFELNTSKSVNSLVQIKIERAVLELALKHQLRCDRIFTRRAANYPYSSLFSYVADSSSPCVVTRAIAHLLRRQSLALDHAQHPEYSWKTNNGRSTNSHWQAIALHGPVLDVHHVRALKFLPHWVCRWLKKDIAANRHYIKLLLSPPAWWQQVFPQSIPLDFLTQRQQEQVKSCLSIRPHIALYKNGQLNNKFFYTDLPADVKQEFLEWVNSSETVTGHKLGYKGTKND